MANTASAKKANRQSKKKKLHNLMWKKRIKAAQKSLLAIVATKPDNTDILNQELSLLQKALDKAVKNNVIHRNSANRIKSRYAKKSTVQVIKPSKAEKPAKPVSGRKSKSTKA